MSVPTDASSGSSFDTEALRRRWLGAFLRAQRARLQPTDVGLPESARRRTPGLRREEVANLASVGTTWYTWLEQGRDISASSEVIAALATALQLQPREREYLFDLAGNARGRREAADEQSVHALERLVADMTDLPAYVADRHWNITAVNRLGSLVFDLVPGTNCLFKFFTDETYASRYPHRTEAERMMVSQFRQLAASFPEDRIFKTIVEELTRSSQTFTRAWNDHRATPQRNVTFDHPTLGRLGFESLALAPLGAADLTLFTYVADLPTSDALATLRRTDDSER